MPAGENGLSEAGSLLEFFICMSVPYLVFVLSLLILISHTDVFDRSNGIIFYFKIMRLKMSFLMIPVQGIKSFYPFESFRDFPPLSRNMTANVTIYRRY